MGTMEPKTASAASESSLEAGLDLLARAARPLVAVVHDLEGAADPVDVAENLPGAWLLLSEPHASEQSRHDILGFDPFLTLRVYADRAELELCGVTFRGGGEPTALLDRCLAPFRGTQPVAGLPLSAGAIGAFAYDLGRVFERLPSLASADLDLPWVQLNFYHALLLRDVRTGRWRLLVSKLPSRLQGRHESASTLVAKARRALAERPPPRQAKPQNPVTPRSTFTPAAYAQCVARIVAGVHAGDVFQVNLSQRFSGPFDGSPHDLFRALRNQSPVPFAALLVDGTRAILSASPERFLHVQGDRVTTWPIKGTTRRGSDPATDADARAALLASAKDRAELAMIIDLERNDLGRVCRVGSINVRAEALVQTLSNVHHLCGVVEGVLRPGISCAELLRATFPGGSVTGAPKLAAMQMIEELEPVRRSFYTGAIGYIGFDGSLDLNVAIRTILMEGGTAHLQVGGGVVADSEPWAEYDETLAKSEPLMRALCWRCPIPPRR